MTSLFGAIEVAKRGLLAGQAGLNVTSHNVANANTPGYSRRVLHLAALGGPRLPEGILGAGVDVRRIERARDRFLEGRILDARAGLGDARARAAFLAEIEATFDDLGGEGLAEALGAFLRSWHDLAVSPESLEVRRAVRDAGAAMASRLNRLSDSLQDQRRALAERIPSEIADVNARIARVAEISRRIGIAEGGGAEAGDLHDARQREIDALAERVDVNFTEAPNGSFILRVGGAVVADGETAIGLTLDGGAAAAAGEGAVALSAGGASVAPRGGTLAAHLDAVNARIPSYLERLDEIAAGLAAAVNAVHESGYGLYGGTGVAFFAFDAEGSDAVGLAGRGAAARIRLADAVSADPASIAASSNGAPGDSAAALAIADLDRARTLRGGTRTLADLAAELGGAVAHDAAEADFLVEARGAFATSLENRRDAISGVSLDEEAVNLVRYQQTYEAAARVLVVANEMIATLLEEVR